MEPGWLLPCEAVEWVDTDWPGWVRVRFVDADGRPWFLVDKVPIFGGNFGPGAQLPMPVALDCDVADHDDQVLIVVPRWGVQSEDGINRFRVRSDHLERVER